MITSRAERAEGKPDRFKILSGEKGFCSSFKILCGFCGGGFGIISVVLCVRYGAR